MQRRGLRHGLLPVATCCLLVLLMATVVLAETTYYDTLGVKKEASPREIRKVCFFDDLGQLSFSSS
jgi:hypothetical protein